MDVSQTRLRNLQALVAALTAGGRTQKSAAIALNMSPSYLNQLLGGKKLGDDVARKIEEIRGLPFGAMDRMWADIGLGVKETGPAYIFSQPLRIDPDTIAAALKLVRLAFLNLHLEINQEENGDPLAYAYEYLFERRESIVTPENVIDFSAYIQKRLLERANVEASTGEPGSVSGSDRQHRQGRKAS